MSSDDTQAPLPAPLGEFYKALLSCPHSLPVQPPLPGSLQEFYETRFQPIRLLGVRPGTIEAYGSALNHWKRWNRLSGIVRLEAITSETLARLGPIA